MRVVLAFLICLCLGFPAGAQFNGGGGTGNTGNFIDPIFAYNAAGVATSTTGTISSGTNSLSVASATGWAVGMGIAVHNAGSGGTTELITRVTAISGTTFTLGTNALATATTQAVNHDDTAALNSAIALAKTSKRPIILSAGTYNVTSALTFISVPISIYGLGTGVSIIQNRGTTNDIFTITYEVLGGALIRDFSILQASGITPSAGFGFNVFAPDVSSFVTDLTIKNIQIQGLYGGITTGAGAHTDWFNDINIWNTVGYGIYYNTPTPAGDNHFVNDILAGSVTTVSFTIVQADTFSIENLKLNGSALLFAGSAATAITRIRIVNPSIEGTATGSSSPPCGIDFGSNGVTQVQVLGGGVGLTANPFCNLAGLTANGGSIIGTNTYLTGGAIGVINLLGSSLVTNLPTCNAAMAGARATVTDQNTAASYRGAVTGSGSTVQGVLCSGAAWIQD